MERQIRALNAINMLKTSTTESCAECEAGIAILFVHL